MARKWNLEAHDSYSEAANDGRNQHLPKQLPLRAERPEVVPKSKSKHGQASADDHQAIIHVGPLRKKDRDHYVVNDKRPGQRDTAQARDMCFMSVVHVRRTPSQAPEPGKTEDQRGKQENYAHPEQT